MKLVTTVKAVAVVAALMAAGTASAGTFADIGGHHRFHVGKNVCPPPIPEAETWAMMGVGLTMLGALARRRVSKKK